MTNLNAVAVSSSSIRVWWELPLQPNSEITSYTVYYRIADATQTSDPINDNSYTTISVTHSSGSITPPTSVVITYLQAYTFYAINVRALGQGPIGNDPLIGDIGIEILRRTDSTVPSNPITAITESPTQPSTTDTIFIYLPPPEQIITGPPM